jgi:hypothetical protein
VIRRKNLFSIRFRVRGERGGTGVIEREAIGGRGIQEGGNGVIVILLEVWRIIVLFPEIEGMRSWTTGKGRGREGSLPWKKWE